MGQPKNAYSRFESGTTVMVAPSAESRNVRVNILMNPFTSEPEGLSKLHSREFLNILFLSLHNPINPIITFIYETS